MCNSVSSAPMISLVSLRFDDAPVYDAGAPVVIRLQMHMQTHMHMHMHMVDEQRCDSTMRRCSMIWCRRRVTGFRRFVGDQAENINSFVS